jgi:transcriptional regulator
MYLPESFAERRSERLHEFIRSHPLGALVVLTRTGLDANHLPFDVDPVPAPLGTLRAHISRANPLYKAERPEVEALVLFRGAQGYVTPSWYPEKSLSGAVVPTWNYIVVHARGALRFIEDPQRIRAHVERMTTEHERARETPWKLADAPADYIAKQLARIVGIEFTLTELVGKWKVSQNRTERDRRGLLAGLEQEAADTDEMVDAVRATLEAPDQKAT